MNQQPITEVQLDALVVLNIIKKCHENLPKLITGQLLGLDVDNVLEVTSSYPFPQNDDDEEGEEFQTEMMRCLRIVNVDSNTVGWYTSTYLGSFLNLSLIADQFSYQESIPNSVVVVYDPLRTSQGTLSLRALRLTSTFMELYKTQKFTRQSMVEAGLSFRNIFDEIPVSVRNSSLVKSFLCTLTDDPSHVYNFERLDLSTNPYLEKNVECLLESADDLVNEQNKFTYHERQANKTLQQQATYLQKREQENTARVAAGKDPLPEEDLSQNSLFKPIQHPSRLDALLITNQIWSYCEEIAAFSGQSLEKMYLAQDFQTGIPASQPEA